MVLKRRLRKLQKLMSPMTLFPKLQFDSIRTISIDDRPRKVSEENLARTFDPHASGEFSAFIDSLPEVLKASELKRFSLELASIYSRGGSIAVMIGGHVIKTGLAPILIDLMRRRIVTSISMNSAASIHDTENALFARTSEDVAANIQDGTFGMSRETGEFINGSLLKYFSEPEIGYGEALGLALQANSAPYRHESLLASAVELGVPVTVHAAIGTDIIHQQPSMRGDVTGELSFRDFRLFARLCAELDNGAAVNMGSAVIMPEVFLKAVTVARNLGLGGRNFITANFDMLQHYRPQMNVLERPTNPDGVFYNFTGHHELMIPLWASMVKLAISQA
jgi:deoxyhypusine synthase